MKVDNPVRIWSLTINAMDTTLDDLPNSKELGIIFQKECKSYVFAKEQGEGGRFHYQCFLHLKDKTRTPLKVFKKASAGVIKSLYMYLWEFSPAKDMKALENYCAKNPIGEVSRFTSDYKPKAFQFEEISLRPIQQNILDLVEQNRNSRSVFVFSDYVGNIGKSTTIKYYMQNHACVFAPSVGTPDSISMSIVKQLAEKALDPTVKTIYLLFDITHTSNLMRNSDKKNNLGSLCESAVTGLLSASFQGKVYSFYDKAGKVCPIIMTNFEPNEYKTMFSRDRLHIYRAPELDDETQWIKV